ncbi:MAG: hypothetical protein ACTH31_11420 [Pseudoclavibacter sp.]
MERTLPQAIGQTEKALTSLLFSRGIGDADIATNLEWVTLNQLRRDETPHERGAFARHVAGVTSATHDDVDATIDALEKRGIVHVAEHVSFTPTGSAQHEAATRRVESLTSALEHDLDEVERARVITTLDAIRERATRLKDAAQHSPHARNIR